MTDPSARRIIGLYDDKAGAWIDQRQALATDGPGVSEAVWLDRFMARLPAGGSVLDVGCGSGRPVAEALLSRGFRVTGIDSSPALIAHARATLPAGEWLVGDMRTLDLKRRFDGVLAWYSLFHLSQDDQRAALPRLLAHGADEAVMMVSTGPKDGEAIGTWQGEPLYHASLPPEGYRELFEGAGYRTEPFDPGDFEGVNGLVWIARRAIVSAE